MTVSLSPSTFLAFVARSVLFDAVCVERLTGWCYGSFLFFIYFLFTLVRVILLFRVRRVFFLLDAVGLKTCCAGRLVEIIDTNMARP